MQSIVEATYPVHFRTTLSAQLAKNLQDQSSVVLIGMKRVGISNFLRFFLYQPEVIAQNLQDGKRRIFVSVDLNDLISRELFPFWTLTLKRLVDAIEQADIPETVKRQSRKAFSQSIQLNDLFFTFDSVRKVIALITEHDITPIIFFVRFDRLIESLTPEFFHNLESLIDQSNRHLSFVFTSYRPLTDLLPTYANEFIKNILLKEIYIPPANEVDIQYLITTLEQRYQTTLSPAEKKLLFIASGGHVQYLQLLLSHLTKQKIHLSSLDQLLTDVANDEEILLQSEEIFETLNKSEKEVLLQVAQEQNSSPKDGKIPFYLLSTGLLRQDNKVISIFSPLLAEYLKNQRQKNKKIHPQAEFTKKEHLLYEFLHKHQGELCEREEIVEAIWPDSAETGVSDWAIDRLVSRVRTKLKKQGSHFQITTVVTRGYKLETV